MKKMWLNALLLCALFVSANAWSATQPEIDAARNKALWWLYTHQNGDGSWGKSNAAVASTATALEALNKAGLRGPLYGRGYSWLANAPALSVDSLARKITAIRLSGGDTRGLVAELLAARNTLQGWGAYKGYDTSNPDNALAINALLLESTYSTIEVTSRLCDILISQQNDGGWIFSSSAYNRAYISVMIPTSYNLILLGAAPTSRGLADRIPCFSSIQLRINSGLTWLLSQRNTVDNGFGPGRVSSLIETTFAYQALSKLAPNDPATMPALDYLLSRQNAADGSWNGDAFQTALVLSLLPPPLVPLVDTDKDGVPDVVEVLAGTNPTVADSRGLASGNGNKVPGLTVPTLLAAEATLGQPFSVQLNTSGGVPPYTWKITTGILPPGITLSSATGLIAGTPTALGSYAFYYTVTDAAAPSNIVANIVAQIDVFKSKPSLASGDINGDGVVDTADVLLAERATLGLITLTSSQRERADVSPEGNPDGVIDAADVLRIRLKALGLAN